MLQEKKYQKWKDFYSKQSTHSSYYATFGHHQLYCSSLNLVNETDNNQMYASFNVIAHNLYLVHAHPTLCTTVHIMMSHRGKGEHWTCYEVMRLRLYFFMSLTLWPLQFVTLWNTPRAANTLCLSNFELPLQDQSLSLLFCIFSHFAFIFSSFPRICQT